MNRLLAVVLLLGACASYSPARQPPPGPAQEEAPDAVLHEKLRSLDAELSSLAAEAAPPDCAQMLACSVSTCALATRICQIADQQTAGSPARARCDDGKARCKSAGERARARGCAPQK